MANYYAQVSLQSVSGESADVNVNTFAATAPAVFTGTEGAHWKSELVTLYNAFNAASALCGRAQNGHTIKIYAAVTTTPNYPIYEDTFNLTSAPAAVDLPLEVNLCVSYANDSAIIVPRGRRRGRIYVGGHTEANNTAGRPLIGMYASLAQQFRNYVEALDDETGWAACIWSRANASLYPIERVWCDDEWDTTRSRGGKATTRSTYIVVP